MKILVINCGSSSIKYKVYDLPSACLLGKGVIENIGENDSLIQDHIQGVSILFQDLIAKKIIAGIEEISIVGHRVVHGGETFQKPCLIDDKVIRKIEECCELAPLHNPGNLSGINGCRKLLPNTPQAAVFDTAFHQTIPDYAYMYAIPYEYYSKYGIRKYGFHGTSHQYVAQLAAKMLKKPLEKLKLITCHLGNGCSITAIDKGKSIDTSMGFTPLEGLMMGTRSGDVDIAAIFYLMEKENLTPRDMDKVLNRKSGFLGVTGVSNDARKVLDAVDKGNSRAKLAWEMFVYRIKHYIGAYMMVLGGADAVCFTAGIGENNDKMVARFKKEITDFCKKTKVLIVPTDEELMIARLSFEVVNAK